MKEGIDPKELTILSDNGGQMKGRLTREHLRREWQVSLEHSRPHTPDDNGWIEAFIKYMKYHPDCPESFDTVQDVRNWVEKYFKHYNNTPHSAIGYVRPNEEHAGFGDKIRQERKMNLAIAKQKRLENYRARTYPYPEQENANKEILERNFEWQMVRNCENEKSGGEVVIHNSSAVLCQNR